MPWFQRYVRAWKPRDPSQMRVCHLPWEVAGQLSLSVQGLRELGIDAISVAQSHRFGYSADIRHSRAVSGSGGDHARRTQRVIRTLEQRDIDVLHYHFAKSLLPRYADVRRFRAQRRHVYIEFWGSDVRLTALERQLNPYFPDTQDYDPSPQRSEERMQRWAELTDGVVIMSEHSLAAQLSQHFDTIYMVGQRVALPERATPIADDQRPLLVVHAPSQTHLKGTAVILEAVAALRGKGLRFDFKLIENLPHDEAMGWYGRADLVIDQVRLGTHGVQAIECMALGKPVVCYLRDDLVAGFPDGLPIINADPTSLSSVLERCLVDDAFRRRHADAGPAYAARVHDHVAVARRLRHIYRTGMQGEHPRGVVDLRGWGGGEPAVAP